MTNDARASSVVHLHNSTVVLQYTEESFFSLKTVMVQEKQAVVVYLLQALCTVSRLHERKFVRPDT